MNAVVLSVVLAAVVDTAARDDDHVAVVADIKIVVDGLFYSRRADYNGDMHAFALGVGLDEYIDAGQAFLCHDVDVVGGVSAGKLRIDAEVVRARGGVVDVGYFSQKLLADIVDV